MPPGHTDCTTMVTPVKDNEKIVKNIPQGKIPIKNSDCLLKPPFPSNIHGTDLQNTAPMQQNLSPAHLT